MGITVAPIEQMLENERKLNSELKAKHKKFVKRAAICGAIATLTILTLADSNKVLKKNVKNLKSHVDSLTKHLNVLDKDVEFAWQNVADNYLAACLIADVVKPTPEQYKQIEAGLIKIKARS